MIKNLNERSRQFYTGIIAVGLFVVLCGMFFVDRGPYKTLVYDFLVIPAGIYSLFNFRKMLADYARGAMLFVFAALLFISLSSLWGSGDFTLSAAVRRWMLYWISGYALFYLYHYHLELFLKVLIVSSAVAALVTIFWMWDYYFVIDYPIGHRFMSGTMDSFDFYRGQGYGAIFNPLLFSHVLQFYLVAILILLSSAWSLTYAHKVTLIFSAIIFLLALAVSQTRMALGLFYLICAYSVIWRYRMKGALMVIGSLVVLVLFLLSYGAFLLERGSSYRFDIWYAIIIQTMENPWLGYGFGSDVVVSPKGVDHTWYDTHNIYLSVLYYSGYAGLLLLLASFINLYRESRGLLCSRYAFNLWLIVLVFGGFTDGGGLLSRPSEHWFNLVLPCMLMIAILRSDSLNRLADRKEKH